jgi:hypothetical protein
MTAVGKILVFMNLLFSVATAGLIVLVFTTRTNFKAEADRWRNVALVAEAAYKSEKIAHENDVKGRDGQNASSNSENKQLADTNKIQQNEIKQLQEEKNKYVAENKLLGTNLDAAVKENNAGKAERALLVQETENARAKTLEAIK